MSLVFERGWVFLDLRQSAARLIPFAKHTALSVGAVLPRWLGVATIAVAPLPRRIANSIGGPTYSFGLSARNRSLAPK